MADTKSLLSDPDFMGLPPEERRKVLRAVDSDFAGLPEAEQSKVVGAAPPQQQPPQEYSRKSLAPGSRLEGLGETMWDNTIGGLSKLPGAVWDANKAVYGDPVGSLKSFIKSRREASGRISQAAAAGDRPGVMRSAIESIPVAGPFLTGLGDKAAAAAGGDERAQGNLAGEALSMIGPGAISRIVGRGGLAGKRTLLGKTGPGVKIGSMLEPREQAAVNWATKSKVPVHLGEASGNPVVQGIEAILAKQPASAEPLRMGRMAQMAALRQKMQTMLRPKSKSQELLQSVSDELAKTPGVKLVNPDEVATVARPTGPAPTVGPTPYFAGEGFIEGAGERIGQYHKKVDEAAAFIRDAAGKDTVAVPTGALDGAGLPVTQEVAGAVSYKGFKDRLRGISEMIGAQIPAEQRLANPALTTIDQILAREGDMVSLSDAMADLSLLKRHGRGADRYLRDRSQGIAASIVPDLHTAVAGKVDTYGGDASKAFKTYNEATVQKYAVDSLRRKGKFKGAMTPGIDLGDEPTAMIRRVMSPGDANAKTLSHILEEFPDWKPKIKESWTGDLIEKAQQTGDWTGAVKSVQSLGPKTRQALGIDADFEGFFRAQADHAALLKQRGEASNWLKSGMQRMTEGATNANSLKNEFVAMDPAARAARFGPHEGPTHNMLSGLASKEDLKGGADWINNNLEQVRKGATTAGDLRDEYYRSLTPEARMKHFGGQEPEVSAYLERLAADEYNQTTLQPFLSGQTGGKKLQTALSKLPEGKMTGFLGPEAADLQKAADFAEMIARQPNATQSATIGSLAAMGAYVIRHPINGTAYLLGARKIAKALAQDGGASLVNHSFRMPFGDPNAPLISKKILALSALGDGKPEPPQ